MENEVDPDNKRFSPAAALVWLLVGLAPIPIFLVLPPASKSVMVWMLIGAICNLLGGIGCLGFMESSAKRLGLGILLAGFFFISSWGMVVLNGCSNSGGL